MATGQTNSTSTIARTALVLSIALTLAAGAAGWVMLGIVGQRIAQPVDDADAALEALDQVVANSADAMRATATMVDQAGRSMTTASDAAAAAGAVAGDAAAVTADSGGGFS